MNKVFGVLFAVTCLNASIWEPFNSSLFSQLGNKLILMKVVRDDCKYCNYMDEKVFSDKQVMNQIQKYFICVKVNISHEHMPIGLDGQRTPSFYILNAQSGIEKHLLGAWNKADFLFILKPFMKEK